MNAVSYKEIFPLIKDNKMWMGNGFQNGNAYFRVEAPRVSYADGVFDESTNLVKFRNCCWYTNIDHGRRHQPLKLMTMAENFKHSKHKEIRGRKDYIHYENYDAIDVKSVSEIPYNYYGLMGVPITFLDKYNPEQFDLIGNTCDTDWLREVGVGIMGQATIDNLRQQGNKAHVTANMNSLYIMKDGKVSLPYARIIIRNKHPQKL